MRAKHVTVVAACSVHRLRRFLKGGRHASYPGRRYLVLHRDPVMERLLRHADIAPWQAPPVTPDVQDGLLREYIQAVGRMGAWNGHDAHWWATDFASKNRFTTPLLSPLTELLAIQSAIEASDEPGRLLILIRPSWCVVHLLKRYLERLEVWAWPWSAHLTRWRGRLCSYARILKTAWIMMVEKSEVAFFFGHGGRPGRARRKTLLIKSFAYPSSFTREGTFRDPFFPDLAGFLRGNMGDEADVLTVVACPESRPACYQKLKALPGKNVVPLFAYLAYGDIVKGAVSLMCGRLRKPFRIDGALSFHGCDIGPLVRALFQSGGWHIPFEQYLYHYAATRIARSHALRSCVLTFEGNPWERMFIKGLQDADRGVFVVGYQHAVIPQAAAGVFISPDELPLCPLPDMVLTTGSIPRRFMRRYSRFPADRLRIACALRYDYLYALKPHPGSSGTRRYTVLVALEGVRQVTSLVGYVLDQAPRCRDVDFVIRAHPVLPFERILGLLRDVEIPSNVHVSRDRTLVEDVRRCHAVLYWGSTVALEALMLGKPVIHFDRGDCLSFDPLFELQTFKWRVAGTDSLRAALETIRSMPEEEYGRCRQGGREYVLAFFHKVQESSLRPFMLVE